MASKVVDPKTYAKNVIKSAGYITAQSLKGVDSDLTNFIKESGSSAKEMYGFLKDFRGNVKRTVNNVLGETGFDDLRRIKSNALDDLRTGKFYNAERENAENSAMMSKLGFSFDFDDLDFDVDEGFGEKKDEETAGVTESTAKSLADKIAEVQRGSSAASATKIAKGARVNTAAMMAFEQKMFGQVTSSIAAVHGSILNLHRDLATPLNTHIINSANFYQAATTELAKQTSLLENINKMLTDRFAPPKHGFNRGKSAFEQVFGGGFPNLSTWGKIAKNRALQEVGVDMIGGMLNPEMMSILLSQASGSPIAQLAILGLTAGMQKSRFGKSVNRFSNTLKGGFMNTAARISNYARKNRNSNSLPAILARLFDIAPGLNKKIDFGNYNKGRAEWTGQDSRALQVVIPTQLAQILSALTGQEAKIYDYKAGKFVTARMAGNQFRKERTAAIGRATGGFKREILQDFIDQDKAKHKNDNTPEYTMNSRAVRNLSRDYDTLMSLLSMHNVDVSQFKKKGDITRFCIRMGWVGNARTSGTKPFFFDRNSIMRIDAAIFRKPGTTGNLAGAMYAGRVGNNNFMADAANGNMAFFAGSDIGRSGKKMSIAHQFLDALDDKGNNVFFYLQDYYKQLRMIANNTRFGTSTSSGEGTGGASSRGSRGAGWQNPEVINRSRNRSTRTRASSGASLRSSSADADPEGRARWNSATESWESPTPKAQSRYTREREKKDGIGAKIVNKITDVTNDLFFGGDSEGIRKWWKDNGGFSGIIKDLPNVISKAVHSGIERAREYVGKKLKEFRKSPWGTDFFGAMKSTVKGFAKDTWNYAKDRSAKAYEWATGKEASWAGQVSPTAYRGGYVRKSGMVSVSEGERILPATGGASPSKRRWIERKNYRDWIKDGGDEDDYWGSFAKGGTAGPRAGYTTINDDDRNIARKMFFEGKSLNEIKDFFKSQNKHNSIAGFIRQSKEFKNKAKGFKDKAKDFIHQQGHNIDEALETLFGSPEKYNNIKGNIKEAYRAAKVNPPKMFAKGTLGALVGAATTGSGLGLLGGFVLGAGHEILQNSEYLSKKLFGEETIDEKTGKAAFKGGILPSKVSVFLKKTFPRMAKGGALGGVLGTLGVAPGGIFGGMVLGAGLELLSTTEGFKRAMFGPVGADGKTRRGGILGSIKLRVVDPLIEFTKNGLQKIGDFVKKNMFDPIKRFGKAASDWIKGKAKSIVANATDKLKEKVKATVGQKIDKLIVKPLAGAAGWVGKKALGAAKTVVSAPFKFVGNTLGGALERHNVKKGYSTLGIDERMKQFGADKNLEYTRKVAGLTGEARDKEIQRYYELLNGSNTARRDMKKARQEMYETIASSFDNGGLDNPAEMKKIRSLLSSEAAINGNLSEVRKYITEESGLGEETQAQLIDILKSKQDRINELKANKDSYEARQQELFKELGITDKRDQKRFIKKNRIQAAIDYEEMQKRKGVVNTDLMSAAKSKDALKAKLKEQEQEQPIDAERNNILKQIASIARGIANHLGVTKDETPEANVSDTAEKLQEKVLPTAEGKPNLDNPGGKISDAEEGIDTSQEGKIINRIEDGDPVEYKVVNGDIVRNESDSGTRKHFLEKMKEKAERSKFFGMFTSGGLLAGLKNLLAPKDGEKEGTFWDKLKGMLTSALPAIIAAIAGYIGIKGLGKFAQKNAGTGLDSGMNKQKDAEERQKEVEGYGTVRKGILGINMIENKIRKRDTTTYDEDDYVSEYATQRYGKRILKNAVLSFNPKLAKATTKGIKALSKIPIVGKIAAAPLGIANAGVKGVKGAYNLGKGAVGIGKSVVAAGKKFASKATTAGKMLFSAVKDVKGGKSVLEATKPLRDKISEAIVNVIKTVKKKLGKAAASSVDDAAEEVVHQVAEEGAEKIVKNMGKNTAKNLSKAVIIIQAALILNAVTYGFQPAGAKCILGIIDDPTLAQRALAAAINGFNEAIPGIGGLIPSNVIFTILYSILKFLGMKFTDLDEKRARAKAVVEEYNKENGTTYNIEEYIKNVLGELTFQDKIKKTIGGGLKKAWNWVTGKSKTVEEDDKEAQKRYEKNKLISDQEYKSNDAALNKKTTVISTGSGSTRTVSGSGSKMFDTVNASVATGSGLLDFTGGASGARLNIKEAAHNIATKIGGVASTAAGYVSKFRSGIINLFTGETEGIPDTDSLIQALWEYTDPTKKLDDFDDTVKKFLSTGITPFGAALVSGVSSIMKMAISLTRPLKTIAATMGTDIANAALVADAITSGGLTGESGTTAARGGIRGALDNFKNNVKSFGDKAWNWLKGNGFTETETGSGSQTIHTTQKGNFDRFGHTTIDENGCGPAVAATVLKAYGKNVGIKTAADYASSNGYVAGSSGVGTRASYFGDILGRSGIRTAYTDNNKAIRKAVASGSPTILLGQDRSNRSKANSPFGPNPHYVVARGTDSRGNVVVDDPELGRTALYKPNILRNAKLGVATGGASGVEGVISEFTGNTFGLASERLGDSLAGRVLRTIFSSSSDNEGSDGEGGTTVNGNGYSHSSGNYESSGGYNFTTGKYENGTILTSKQYVNEVNPNVGSNTNRAATLFNAFTAGNLDFSKLGKYKYWYQTVKNGGLYKGDQGVPAHDTYDVVDSAVGWACARFNHIYTMLSDHKSGMAFPDFICDPKDFPKVAASYGISLNGTELSQSPQVGAIMVWGPSPSSGGNLKGHVAIVEKVESSHCVITSESGYATGHVYSIRREQSKCNGRWGMSSVVGGGSPGNDRVSNKLVFLGFIYNPAIVDALAVKTSREKTIENSPLTTDVIISPNKTPRTHPIDTITIHCTGGHGTARAIGSLPHFCGTTSSYGRCSSNYGIGDDGSIGLYAPENYRSWCSGGDRKVNGMSGGDNDDRAITIEVCCDPNHPYKVTDAAYDATIRLLADVCLRNGIKKLLWKNDPDLVGQVDKQNMTVHRWWANKACPGDYLMDHMGDIANQVNRLISGFPGTADKIIGNAPLKIINDQENTDPSAYQGTSNGSSSSGNGFTRGKNIGKACYMDSNYKPGAEDHAAIWKFLKSQGASDHAAAAIIGAWCGESGGRGDSVEGYYLPNYPGTENVMKTYESMDDFTKNILFPAYAGRISINKEAYKDFSGKYYLPGIGVRGFTGPLADGLITYSRNHKEDWRLIETQLHFMANDPGEHSRMQNIIAKLNGQRNMRDSVAEIMASYQGMGWDWTNANGATVDYRTQAANNVLSRFKGSGSGLVGGKSGMEASVSSNAFANNSGPSDAAKKYINTIFKRKEATLPYGGSELLQTAAMTRDPKKSITHYTGVTKAQYSKNDKDIANFINGSNSVQASYSAMLNSKMANIPPTVASPSAMGSGIKKFKGTVFDDSTLNFTGGRSELATPASAVPSQQSPVYVGNNSNYTKQLTDMISYVKKIADNTTYNASTPVLIEVVTKAVELLGVIAGNSGTSNSRSMATNAESADFNQYIQDQITQMKAKMETIATTL